MDPNRRQLLRSFLFGTGWLGLRALATGLPASLLAAPLRASAADTCNATDAHYLVLVTSDGGDPLNANVPGCYQDPGIYHPPQASMAPATLTLSGQAYTAARPWADLATLSPGLLDRTCFFHHGTYTVAHGDAAKVNALMGAVKRQEMLVSVIAKNTAPCLGTTQPQPVVLADNLIRYAGAVQPVLSPGALQDVLAAPADLLGTLRQRRDADLDRIHALMRQSGTTAQRAMVDRYALSQSQARSLAADLLSDLSTIGAGDRLDQNTAAAVMLRMNVSPVVVLRYDFGGDNHSDGGLWRESQATVDSVAALADLVAKLTRHGIQDRTTILLQNVFGRTLGAGARGGDTNGRDHNAGHHCSVIIDSRIRGSVVGGPVAASGGDYRARGLVSATGAPDDAGDVPYEATLASVGKTVGAAVGVSREVLDDQITAGKVVPAALRV